jgi:hypothetical protein
MYTHEAGAKNGIKALVEWANGKEAADVKDTHFVVRAKNGAPQLFPQRQLASVHSAASCACKLTALGRRRDHPEE